MEKTVMHADISQQLQQQVQHAFEHKQALSIVGGNSKAFYGRAGDSADAANVIEVAGHKGVLNYEPTELVITARAGTPLREIEQLLDSHGQMLPFEPPAYSDSATIGGTIACNLSGPRRVSAGAARDFLLGCKLINGKGDILTFGGEVMKNVAGYDVSRLMAGALGTLGVLLEVSLKVLPRPEVEITQRFDCTQAEALDRLHAWLQTPLPISASSFHDSLLSIRLSGAEKAVQAAIDTIGGDTMADAGQYWHLLKEHQLAFFRDESPLWRLSIASDTDSLKHAVDDDNCLIEWGGALRWLKTNAAADAIQAAAAQAQGHATLFRGNDQNGVFQPLAPGLLRIHKNLKQAFDPANILNPGRLYPEL